MISLADSIVVPVLNTYVSSTDGLTVDDEGYLYFSAWSTNCVYKVDLQSIPPISIFSSGHHGPADIYFNPVDRMMAIPNFNSNNIDFIYMSPTSVENNQNWNSTLLNLRISPNPFSDQVQISYTVSEPDNIKISIWDTSGSQVWSTGEKYHEIGDYSESWNGVSFRGTETPPGLYFLKIQSSVEKVCMKIIRF